MTTIERAMEIARSGKAPTVADIREQLNREGFDSVQEHLGGRGFQKQLRALINGNRP